MEREREKKEEKPGGSRAKIPEGEDEKSKRRDRSRSQSSDYSYSSAGSARHRHAPAHQGTRKMRREKKKYPKRAGRVTKHRGPNRPKAKNMQLSAASLVDGQLNLNCNRCGRPGCVECVNYKSVARKTRGRGSNTSICSNHSTLECKIYCKYCKRRSWRRS